MTKKEIIASVIKFIITVLTAVMTTFGLASCSNATLNFDIF